MTKCGKEKAGNLSLKTKEKVLILDKILGRLHTCTGTPVLQASPTGFLKVKNARTLDSKSQPR